MNPDLVEEIEYMIDILTKSGFFDTDEILEILEDEFIEEDVTYQNAYALGCEIGCKMLVELLGLDEV